MSEQATERLHHFKKKGKKTNCKNYYSEGSQSRFPNVEFLRIPRNNIFKANIIN
jgi:hypothetical protein